jgi:SAM-dependent methyltransferase
LWEALQKSTALRRLGCERTRALSIEVLTKSADNARARLEMRRLGLDFASPRLARLLRKAHLMRGVNVGLLQKSWDVLRTLQFLEKHAGEATRILDLGACSSEILLGLYKMGFRDLTGIDLDPGITRMPNKESIKYVTGDFTETAFPEGTFGAITAISVLEHGFCGPKVFGEVSRILRMGGYFIGSIDYWPEKVCTRGVTLYGCDWRIFSKGELLEFVEEAGKHGLLPIGPLNFEAAETTVHWLKRSYTFAWFAFQRVDTSVPDHALPKADASDATP